MGRVADLLAVDGSGPTRQRTSVEVSWSQCGLDISFEAQDDDVWATHTEHDANLWEEEVVEVFLAPGSQIPTSYLEIEVNPLGAVFDARIDSPHGDRADMIVDRDWHCVGLERRVRTSPLGWRVELHLPWSGLGVLGEIPARWRANFYRIDRPRNGQPIELGCWSPTLTSPGDFHRPARFGLLELEGVAASTAVLPASPLDPPVLRVPWRARMVGQRSQEVG